MTKFGTRLSGALYILLLLGLVIVGLGLLVRPDVVPAASATFRALADRSS